MTEKLKTISLLCVECGMYQTQKNQEGLLPAGVRGRARVFEGFWKCRWKCTQKLQGPLADPAQPRRQILKQPWALLSYLPLHCGIVVQDVVPSTVTEKQSIIFLKSLSPENRFSADKRCSITKM